MLTKEQLVNPQITAYVVDFCEYPTNCDMPECSCPRLFTSKYVRELMERHRKETE